ncbi:hypothetical protein SUDANB120_04997 [Streptomyces sp. enrichment culture]
MAPGTEPGVGFSHAGYRQSRFSKTTYRLVQTTAISSTLNGWSPAPCSSGSPAAFMPQIMPPKVGAGRKATHEEIFLKSSPSTR